MGEKKLYILASDFLESHFHVWVLAAVLSYRPVKTDLDRASGRRLDDPLTAERVLVVSRPPWGQDHPIGSREVATAGGYREEYRGGEQARKRESENTCS